MIDQPNSLIRALQILFAGILIIAIVFLLSFLPSANEASRVEAKAKNDSNALTAEMSGSPNVVASGMAVTINGFGRAVNTTAYALNDSLQSVASATTQVSKSVADGVRAGTAAAGRTLGKGIGTVGRAIGDGVVFMLKIPGNLIGSISNSSAVSGVIRPSDNMDVPIIDPDSPELRAALTALPANGNGTSPAKLNAGPAWPIHGNITTHFGVPHWPYQATHSGIDISDGRAPGVTPIKPFRPGKVIATESSYYGLGNHVIVDHGSGVTSVYAHLASIAVRVGQEISLNTILGYEGSTGASTGTHLHFEIRVNGKAADPRQFISGQP